MPSGISSSEAVSGVDAPFPPAAAAGPRHAARGSGLMQKAWHISQILGFGPWGAAEAFLDSEQHRMHAVSSFSQKSALQTRNAAERGDQ